MLTRVAQRPAEGMVFHVNRPCPTRQWAVHLLSANGELLPELRFRSYGAAEAFCDALPEHQDFILVGAVS